MKKLKHSGLFYIKTGRDRKEEKKVSEKFAMDENINFHLNFNVNHRKAI